MGLAVVHRRSRSGGPVYSQMGMEKGRPVFNRFCSTGWQRMARAATSLRLIFYESSTGVKSGGLVGVKGPIDSHEERPPRIKEPTTWTAPRMEPP